jgi:hypothetical protein
MKQYISRNLLVWIAWGVQIWTVCWQIKAYGTIRGDALIPLLGVYAAIRVKGAAARRPRSRKGGMNLEPNARDARERRKEPAGDRQGIAAESKRYQQV